MKLYKYGMRLRGFSPGCQPLDGLRRAEEGAVYGLEQYYDILFYDRELSEAEQKLYDLDFVGKGEDA